MARAKKLTDDELITRYIVEEPYERDRAWLRGYGVEVWALIAYYQDVYGRDLEAVARGFDIPVEAVKAALAYYAREQELINARLTLLREA